MHASFQLVILIGLASIPVGGIGVLLLARGRHIAIAAAAGLLCAIVGYQIGVEAFCSTGAGNLCGLAGAFGTAPIGFAMGAYAALSRAVLRGSKRAPLRRDF